MRREIMSVVLVTGLFATGCATPAPSGSRTIDEGRAHYNVAIQRTNAEQLLLNLVRLRYREPTYFLEVSSVSTGFEFSNTVDAAGTFVKGVPNPYDLGLAIRTAEKPTVTYLPLQGEKFVKQVMSPIRLEKLLLLLHSGWSVERVFRTCLWSMNDVPNAPTASGPTPDQAPRFRRFTEAVALLRGMQTRSTVQFGMIAAGDEAALQLRLDAGDPDAARLRELLGLATGTDFPIREGLGGRPADAIVVVPRSMMASMYYLSQGIDVPADHEEEGRVTVTRNADGSRFDWGEMTGDLFRVHAGRAPRDAFVAIRYRGTDFWIDDADLTSKSTFSLLTQLFALQAGETPGGGPILTLPIAQ